MNPKWLAYMRASGATEPAAFLAAEQERWPGGCMVGFMLWIAERKRDFARLHPEYMMRNVTGRPDPDRIWNLNAWDAFVEA